MSAFTSIMSGASHLCSGHQGKPQSQHTCSHRPFSRAAASLLSLSSAYATVSPATALIVAKSCSRHGARAGFGHFSLRRGPGHFTAYGKGSGAGSTDPNYYELLGLEPDCDEEDIRAAFRRRAKELHPDVNKEDGATEAFVQLSRAYEVLSDSESRREYDITHRNRHLNFFRDIVEEEDEEGRRSSFRWSHVGRRQGGSRQEEEDRDEQHGRDGDEDGEDGHRWGEEGEQEEEEDDGEGARGKRWRSQEEVLEQLAKFMSGSGSLRAWQSGRLDPWGTSGSDAWFKQVERQTRSPYGPSRPGYGTSQDEDEGSDWGPSRRVPGWSPPGRGSEWNHPRRQWDSEDQREGGPGRRGGGGGGSGGGDIRRPFKI